MTENRAKNTRLILKAFFNKRRGKIFRVQPIAFTCWGIDMASLLPRKPLIDLQQEEWLFVSASK